MKDQSTNHPHGISPALIRGKHGKLAPACPKCGGATRPLYGKHTWWMGCQACGDKGSTVPPSFVAAD